MWVCGQKWLARLTPFFTAKEREEAGCQHRLFFSQVEFCDNLIFQRRAALDKLGERLLDANRTIGQPNKITVIFGRRISKHYRGKLQTEIEDMDLPNPVIRSHYGNGFVKQYVRDHLILRTEAASNNVNDYGVNKSVQNLPALRSALSAINDNYLDVQQDILETFIDRGQLRKLAEPTITPTGKRIPGLKLDHPRQLALMHALVRFAHIAGGNTFSTADLHPRVLTVLGCAAESYTLASLRYDLAKLRAKGLVTKLPHSRRYQLLPHGYSICLVFLKLFERVYRRLPPACSAPSARILESTSKSDLSSIASINASLMTSTPSSAPSASKPRDTRAKREQNPRHGHYNGLKRGLNRTTGIPTSMPTVRPQNGKVSCAAGPARPDGKLKRSCDVGQQPQRRPGGPSGSLRSPTSLMSARPSCAPPGDGGFHAPSPCALKPASISRAPGSWSCRFSQ
jgi:hypothetical protein